MYSRKQKVTLFTVNYVQFVLSLAVINQRNVITFVNCMTYIDLTIAKGAHAVVSQDRLESIGMVIYITGMYFDALLVLNQLYTVMSF